MQSIFEIADIQELTVENSRIVKEGDFPVLFFTENGEEKRIGIVEIKRAFPFETKEEYLILANEENIDCGFLRRLADRTEEEQIIIRNELEARYFMPEIYKINSLKDHFGYSYWGVDTSIGSMDFSVRDTYRSLIHLGNRLIITDADGNRYEIPDITTFDKASRKKIDIYLW